MPRVALARVGRRDLVRQPYRLQLGNGAPRLRRLLVGDHKHFLRWTRDGTWDRALAELRRQVRHAHGRNPEPRPG
jgi:hypothetical protein